ncbi:hypothetical protein TTHERM_000999079 (macronuclear) [Tetrahymena thermophila SB210]|uniref:Uncharacterized protein n=1 Tax=Tetrahymena thermophila (strain SB210) TaxID=312017 RepID=W7XJ07_TETTS|nr:hypothetical protein TTHERM_000999079 [Tetrahymena thermophila SB210]EWS73769.1 hypothetical protein TTHERM_000999079 [Tetrahymena thermophila SB210]|eukprot:XP_012653700.1 hypothetical protein TTHERM_000999079 [Tetrahymena thermophila SB210]
MIDVDKQQIVQSFNSENKPYISFPLSQSYNIIYQNKQNYDAYFIDKNTSKVLKLNLISQEVNQFEVNVNVDQIYIDDLLSAAIFTTQKSQIYDLNIIYLTQSRPFQKIFSYDKILNFQVCKNQQRAIIQTSFTNIYIVDYVNNLQQKIELQVNTLQNLAQYKILCEDNLMIQYTPFIVEYLIKESIKKPIQYYVKLKIILFKNLLIFDLKRLNILINSR